MQIIIKTLDSLADDQPSVQLRDRLSDKQIAYRMKQTARRLAKLQRRPNCYFFKEYATEGDIVVADGIYPVYILSVA